MFELRKNPKSRRSNNPEKLDFIEIRKFQILDFSSDPNLVIFDKIEFQDTIEFDCNLVVTELNVDFFNFWNLWNSTFYFDNRPKISHCPSQHRELILLRNSYVT